MKLEQGLETFFEQSESRLLRPLTWEHALLVAKVVPTRKRDMKKLERLCYEDPGVVLVYAKAFMKDIPSQLKSNDYRAFVDFLDAVLVDFHDADKPKDKLKFAKQMATAYYPLFEMNADRDVVKAALYELQFPGVDKPIIAYARESTPLNGVVLNYTVENPQGKKLPVNIKLFAEGHPEDIVWLSANLRRDPGLVDVELNEHAEEGIGKDYERLRDPVKEFAKYDGKILKHDEIVAAVKTFFEALK